MARILACASPVMQSERELNETARVPESCLREILDQAVLRVFMVASDDLWSHTRGCPRAAFARQVAMYLAHVTCGLSLTEVGQLFVRDRTTVAHACGLIEDLRDDPVLDRSLDLLEGVLRKLSWAPRDFSSHPFGHGLEN
jgi:chromosomal replication initiation ATPase DnaA